MNTYSHRTFSKTHSRILSGTRPLAQTVSDVCLERISSLDTSAFSALEVLGDNQLYTSTYLLTYLLTSTTYLHICCFYSNVSFDNNTRFHGLLKIVTMSGRCVICQVNAQSDVTG